MLADALPMNGSAFLSLATIRLPAPARLLATSWCPDKDLLVLVTRLGDKDRLSLWKMHGSKKWEIGFDSDVASSSNAVVDIAWSPDGQTIAVAHNPPRITLHSIQDGQQERVLPVVSSPPSFVSKRPARLSYIWWFNHEKEQNRSRIPDLFNRNNDITGSAHSMLKGQPLLDPLEDDSQPLTATDLFAFQGVPTRSTVSSLPPLISSWPTLPVDPFVASIQPSRLGGNQPRPGEDLDVTDDANVNSLLMVSNDAGHVYSFLDGSYPLGSIHVDSCAPVVSLYKEKDVLFAHPHFFKSGKPALTSLRPYIVHLPELGQRFMRDMARTSSSARELLWYAMRVIKEMRKVWFGGDGQPGAREIGPKWVRALEARQREEFGQEEPYAMLDLTCLLTTDRTSESLADYLGSGEQMSERGLQKWESTVIEALVKLRDFAEKRVAPACQRLHLLLEEMLAWTQLTQYAACGVDGSQVNACLNLARRAIIVAGWLAATTRKELLRFKEFIAWLKYEMSRANTGHDASNHPSPKHDIVEVNDYLMSGLVVSPIDKWFMGPVPQFSGQDLTVPDDKLDLKDAISRARLAVKDQRQTAWQSNIQQKDLSHLDRNLDSLIQELASRCQRIFTEAAGATSRSAVVLSSATPGQARDQTLVEAAESLICPLIRERTVADSNQGNSFTQYLAMQMPPVDGRTYLCLTRIQHSRHPPLSLQTHVSIIECCSTEETGTENRTIAMDPLDVQFFDDNVLVMVYRTAMPGPATIATVGYSDLIYQTIELETYVTDFAREALILEAMRRMKDGQLTSVPAPIIQSRMLAGCRKGKAFLAVNGRIGRRVACVLDEPGMHLEILDMEGEEEETDMSAVEA